MKCPYCQKSDTKVVDSRESEGIRRRRECLKCGKRFTTYERVEQVETFIVKKDNRREQFNRDKLKRGLLKACEKRPIQLDRIDKVLDKIEAKVRSSRSNEVDSAKLGEQVMTHLKRLDKVAYIRYASVYRDFQDIQEFEKELKVLKKGG